MLVQRDFLDEMYDDAIATTGAPPVVNHFDRSALVPLHVVADRAAAAAGLLQFPIPLAELAGLGWMPVRPCTAGGLGAPPYAAKRIAYFHRLQREQGYTTEELRVVAQYEEEWIDRNVGDGFRYGASDVEVLIQRNEERMAELQTWLAGRWTDGEPRSTGELPAERAAWQKELAECEEALDVLRVLLAHPTEAAGLEIIRREASHWRTEVEFMRLATEEIERARVLEGFSPWIIFKGHYGRQDGWSSLRPDWERTLGDPIVAEAAGLPLRLPGFRLIGDDIWPTRTLGPTDYTRRWQQFRLDGYLAVRRRLQGARGCAHCGVELADAVPARQYCNEACRNRAKAHRFRQQRKHRALYGTVSPREPARAEEAPGSPPTGPC